jgi:putative alpha-1,2-mannosidase
LSRFSVGEIRQNAPKVKLTMKSAAKLVLSAFLGPAFFGALAQSPKEPVDYVSLNIGGIGILLSATIPYAQYPHPMVRLYPVTTPGIATAIQSAMLNGKPLDKPWFHHADIADGGKLALEMGDTPNTSWGSAPQDAPPSMSSNSAEQEQATHYVSQ